MWNKWASRDTIVDAAKIVGISKEGLNVNNMQQDKFQQAANCMAQNQKQGSSGSLVSCTQKKTLIRISKLLEIYVRAVADDYER